LINIATKAKQRSTTLHMGSWRWAEDMRLFIRFWVPWVDWTIGLWAGATCFLFRTWWRWIGKLKQLKLG
jgi:hypothetical protein